MRCSITSPPLFIAALLGCCLYLQHGFCVSANLEGTGESLSSRKCISTIASKKKELGDECVKPVCGPLNTTGDPLEEHLSASCRAVLDKYVAKDLTSVWGESVGERKGCQTFPESQHATNPVVVQNQNTRSFGFCSVPKAACSQLRSLLFVITRYPDPVNWIGEMWRVHLQKYPSLYHFDVPQPLPSSFPTFILGRNPYTRLLSGFLDKMTVQKRGNDMFTLNVTNVAMGRGEYDFFEKSREGFRDFLVQIIAVMKAGKQVNEHFAPMVAVCNVREVPYHYFLRLEDMTQWMPCLRESLNLGQFTDLGWDHDRKLRSDWYEPKHTGCWWHPKGMSCKEYIEQAADFVQGHRATIKAPLSNIPSGSQSDVHSTSADDKLELFYDQEIADMVYEAYRIDFEAFGYERLVM